MPIVPIVPIVKPGKNVSVSLSLGLVRHATHLYSPVKNCLTFSAVFGTTSAKSSICTLPAGVPPMVTSAAKFRSQLVGSFSL